ncbi:multicopper oxidase domain-containing protein [Georgenia sp. Z1344]|uniref:multicopper oxidase domain-containing protein n=1 Tax=Georgenia sp. Z1344 TaxID=3416706 RepID=UPI003CF5022F
MRSPSARGFRPLRDLPALVWLAALVVAVLVHPWVPAPRWLMLHLFFLGAITHSILVWSEYFATALLRAGTDRRAQDLRLALSNGGAAVVVAGILTDTWALVLVGAALVAAAVLWHGASLAVRLRRALGSRFAVTVRYYLAAVAFLGVGATLGVLLARDPAGQTYDRLILAHALVNVLGWMGLTILGTLVTLWPTILRTRMLDGAVTVARRSLLVLAGGLAVAAAGALTGRPEVLALGLAGYAVGTAWSVARMVRTVVHKRPTTYAAWSVAAGVLWLLACLTWLVVGALRGIPGDLAPAAAALDEVAPYLAAGTGAQVLIGAMSYLLPVQLSRGPASARAANAAMDRGAALRVGVANAMLLICVLPVPSAVRVLASVAYLVAMAAFVPVTVGSVRAARRAHTGPTATGPTTTPAVPPTDPAPGGTTDAARVGLSAMSDGAAPAPAATSASHRPQLAGVLVAVLGVVVAGVLVDPTAAGLGTASASSVPANGRTETVEVVAEGMTFTPDRIEVEAGTELILEVTNADAGQVHDLVLPTGHSTPRLAPGESATLEVGVVGESFEGWCSIIGHRQQGMTLDVVVSGGVVDASTGDDADSSAAHGEHGSSSDASENATVDPAAVPSEEFEARDASLEPLPEDQGPVTHRETWSMTEEVIEVAPGVTQQMWTFDGSAPGPTLHGRVGDTFEITIVNEGTMGHSLDFHASEVAPDGPMRTIAPGESLTYTFTANRSGVWMYHCGTAPASQHIASGMAGTVVIEPEGLPEVDRSYVISQSELYLGAGGGALDTEALAAQRPSAMTFNGYVDQYLHDPLEARVGDRVRFWVMDLGPNRPTAFHVIGGQFDTVWTEGDYLLRDGGSTGDGGSQALALGPSQGGFVELSFAEPGSYTVVTHHMVDAEMGARGIIEVE